MYSISRWGRARVFGMSMKKARVLMPGGVVVLAVGGNLVGDAGCGAGGGVGYGDLGALEGVCDGLEDVMGDGVAATAFLRCDWILSLYTAFSSSTFWKPSLSDSK